MTERREKKKGGGEGTKMRRCVGVEEGASGDGSGDCPTF